MNTQDLDRIRFVTSHFNELQGLRMLVPLGLVQLAAGLTAGFAGVLKLLLPLPWLPLLPFTMATLAAFFLMLRSPSYYRSFGQVERQSLIPSAPWAPLSVFNPAGAPPPIETYRQPVPLRARQVLQVLIPMGLALTLLVSLQVVGSRVSLLTDSSAQDPWLQFTPPVVLVMDHSPTVERIDLSSPVPTEMMYAIFGSFFLLLWLLRGGHLSQCYILAFALLLLGLPVLALLLGFGASIPPFLSGLPLLALAYIWMSQILCGSAMFLIGLLDHWQLVRVLGRPIVENPS